MKLTGIDLRHRALFAFVAFAFMPATVGAQELTRTIRVGADNDYFNFWIPPRQRSDDNYTHGMRVAWNPSGVPSFGKKIVCREATACGASVEIGQEMYTPTYDSPTPLTGQRPYAGWLYGRMGLRSASETIARNFGLVAGVTGSASFAETVQRTFHKQFGFREPLGWHYQLANEPAFAVTADQSWHIAPKDAARFVDVVPVAAISIGTLRTAVSAAGRMRLGTNLNHPWIASRSHPWLAAEVFLGGRAEAVARDLFLDGNTFEKSVRVDSKHGRTSWERGVRLDLKRAAVEYGVTTLSREYVNGPISHTYSSIGVIWAMN